MTTAPKELFTLFQTASDEHTHPCIKKAAGHFENYKKRRGDIGRYYQSIKNEYYKKPENLSPLQIAWVNLIESVRKINDPDMKLLLINGWTNTNINYDKERAKKLQPDGEWLQTPQQTLDLGTGICSDQAYFKYETALLAGIPGNKLSLTIVAISKFNRNYPVADEYFFGHMVLLAETKYGVFALNNQTKQDGNDEIDTFAQHAMIERKEHHFSKNGISIFSNLGTFMPLSYLRETANQTTQRQNTFSIYRANNGNDYYILHELPPADARPPLLTPYEHFTTVLEGLPSIEKDLCFKVIHSAAHPQLFASNRISEQTKKQLNASQPPTREKKKKTPTHTPPGTKP